MVFRWTRNSVLWKPWIHHHHEARHWTLPEKFNSSSCGCNMSTAHFNIILPLSPKRKEGYV